MISNKIKHALISLIILISLSYTFSGIFNTLDNYVSELKFKLRTETQTDSSIIILYLDNEDINVLGGLPLKRNYYALAINILNELNAKVIGLDIALIDRSINYPEYDDLLRKSISSKQNVILTSYFNRLKTEEPNLSFRLPENVGYKISTSTTFFSGEELNLPFSEFLEVASSIGHANLTEKGEIPIFIAQSNGLMPAFAFELFRTYIDAKKENINISDSKILIKTSEKVYTIPLSKEGIVNLNFSGGAKSLNAIPLVEFIQSYNLYKKGGITDIDVNIVRNKIVIISIVASGRSVFVKTPFSAQYPAVGLHATFIDNAINGTFIKTTPLILELLLILVAGIFFSYLGLNYNETRTVIMLISYFILFLIVSFILFKSFNFDLSITRHFILLLIQTGFIIVYNNKLVREKIYNIEKERDLIRKRLHEREEKLIKLQDELRKAELENSIEKKDKLVSEIKKFEKEVDLLKLQINDYAEIYQVTEEFENFEGIIYTKSSPMKDVVEFVKKISDNDSPVLILGESGTGKELIARAIHKNSKRVSKPFVALNCGALTETLLESELFGYEKGAFTGAVKEKAGRFELADGGTIFLDEIAETSEAFQVKLLRVLQEGEFERVGGTETKKVNVRVLAATNKNITENINEKKFRQDLFYRLSVFVINLPPLRERIQDIPVLTKHFIQLEDKDMKCSGEVLELLSKYQFNGNVRELQSIIKRAVVLANAEKRNYIKLVDLPDEIKKIQKNKLELSESIISSLRRKNFSKNSISETAKDLGGINRSTVAEYLRGYCFKIIVEKSFNVEEAVLEIAGKTESEVVNRVRKKIQEYLRNALENIDRNLDFETNLQNNRAKFKNLPQKYHFYLEEIIKNYLKGKITI